MRSTEEILKNTKFSNRQIELFLARCYMDFLYFAEHMLGFEIADYHKEWFTLVEKYPRVSIQAFRGSGKTNFFAGYYIWKAIFNKNLNFLIVSGTFEQSKMVLKIIRTMIAENDMLKQFIPEGRDMSWKATELNLKNGATFYCKTYGEGVRGLRIDYLMCDEAGQYEDKSIFWQVISPVVQLNRGRIIVVGTPRSHVDLLNELHENNEYFAKKFPSEIEGKPLWPQKYTIAQNDTDDKRSLPQVRKEIGELNYMQEYLLVPISSANSIFPLDMILRCVDNTEKFLPFGKINEKYYVGVDLAVTQTGDWSVYTVISANADGKRLVYAERFRDNFEEQKKRLKKIYDNFKPVKICIDKTGCGEQIFRDLQLAVPGIEPVHFTYDEKFSLLMDLRHELEMFNLTLPNSKDDLVAYGFTQTLIKEMSDFVLKVDLENRTKTKTRFGSGKNDDTVISLALANRASQNVYGNVSISML